ncbi:MAG TPA: carboxypeptidase regulatory-like domain-containing protein, partial [Bacteroidia bacterium]
MPVDGKVFAGSQKASGAIVTLFKNGQQMQQVVTTSNGKFSFELPPNAEYIISITKPGFITKKFKIVTANVPPDRAEGGNFNPFEPDVTLFEMPVAPEISKRVEAILSQPIAVYQYIPAESNFNYDEKYTQVIQDKLNELAQLQKQVEKQMEEKVKNAAIEAQKQKEIDDKYKAAIAKADKAFGNADYKSAKSEYNDALSIKPAEAYPKQKLSEIDKLLADASKQKELDDKYKAAITKADNAFGSKDYASAKSSYTEASGLKPNESYPKQKLSEIDKLLADASKQKDLDDKYKAAITKGDNSFKSKDYASAKSSFTEASGLKPSEQYPKTKLDEIEKLLNAAASQKELDDKYKAAIAKADNAFGAKDYISAKSSYTEANGLKPNESYPKQKLSEIDKLLADASKQKDVDDKYKAAIAKADNAFG